MSCRMPTIACDIVNVHPMRVALLCIADARTAHVCMCNVHVTHLQTRKVAARPSSPRTSRSPFIAYSGARAADCPTSIMGRPMGCTGRAEPGIEWLGIPLRLMPACWRAVQSLTGMACMACMVPLDHYHLPTSACRMP